MASLTVRGVAKSYGPVAALAGLDLDVPAGSLTAVLGPSGCGKTTLLRCVAGFERVDAGEIAVGARTVAGPGRHLAPERRKVAVVPQEGALFPHLPVAGNVAYGLDRAARRRGRVEEVLALVGLAGYGARMPHQLSGGQQQRVAVARALAPRPPLVLLDEPFSALDAGLRAEVRRDVRAALRADGATAVLVTHDQGEALSIADHVAVMRAGQIVQRGTPDHVYRNPADPWVAGFVGEAVLVPGTVHDGVAHTPLGPVPLHPAPPARAAASLAGPAPDGPAPDGPAPDGPLGAGPGAAVTILLRPEQLDVLVPPDSDGDAVPATVSRQDFFGHDALLVLRLDDGSAITARVFGPAAAGLGPGQRVGLRVHGPAHAFSA